MRRLHPRLLPILSWLAASCLAAWPAAAEPTLHARINQFSRTYELHADLTYVETVDVDIALLTDRGIQDRERSTFSFYPASQSLEVLEAWVDQPDGTRLQVPQGSRFTRPSEAAQNAPGFTGAMTTTLLYPQLRIGSRTHVRWRLTQKLAPVNGFNVWAEPPLDMPVGVGQVTITAPEALPLHWAARGGFEVAEHVAGGQRTIAATIRGTHAEEPERDAVATADFQPLFLATSLARIEDVGDRSWRQSHARMVVTPEISALAARLAGGLDGEAAARRVYDWVAGNIRYVAVYMDPNDGWVPHAADEVLRAGYGDCKDHVVLMQALLGALGIRAEAAVVDWGNRTTDAPLWVPQFNHAIVYLPDYDRYLNPTNPYARYGSLDARLAGKLTVRATPLGGMAGRTPEMRAQDSLYRVDSRVRVEADGTLVGSATIAMPATIESWVRASVARASSPEDLPDRLLASTPEGGFGTFRTSDPHDLSQPFAVAASWHSPHAMTFQGNTAYLTVPVGPDPDPPARLRQYLSATGARRHALLASAGVFEWSTRLAVADGLAFASVPADVALRNAAGSYEATYERDGGEVRVLRRLVLLRDVYSAADYPDLEALLYAPLSDSRGVVVVQRPQAMAGTP